MSIPHPPLSYIKKPLTSAPLPNRNSLVRKNWPYLIIAVELLAAVCRPPDGIRIHQRLSCTPAAGVDFTYSVPFDLSLFNGGGRRRGSKGREGEEGGDGETHGDDGGDDDGGSETCKVQLVDIETDSEIKELLYPPCIVPDTYLTRRCSYT